MIRVFITDDHVIMREGLKRVIADEKDMTIAGEAANGADCIALLRKQPIDVLLLDIGMPGRDGISTLRQIKQELPGLSVLILSMYPEDQYAVRMLKAGASGYLTKETDYEQLVLAIRKVASGKKYISASVAELLAESLDEGNPEIPHAMLSNRELQILLLLANGKPVGRIAEELSLSAKTVSTYRTRILKKMHLQNTAELMHYVITHGLLTQG